MDLLQMKGNVLTITPQALAMKDFNALWTRDKTKNKERAVAELSYVWFMEETKSPFYNILNEEERSREVIKVLDHLPKAWKPDAKVKAAQVCYTENDRSVAKDLLKNAIRLLIKIDNFISSVDPGETYKDKQGVVRYKHDFKKLMDTSKQIPPTLEQLRKTMELVSKEEEAEGGIRGSLEKTVFEDEV